MILCSQFWHFALRGTTGTLLEERKTSSGIRLQVLGGGDFLVDLDGVTSDAQGGLGSREEPQLQREVLRLFEYFK